MADRRRSAGSAPQRGGVRVDVILYSALSRNATFFAEKQESENATNKSNKG